MKNFVKRSIDFTIAFLLLLVLWPLFLGLCLLLYIKMGNPVFFCQLRPGKEGRSFKMYKFRTMTWRTNESGSLLPDAMRLTKLGVFLRSTSLDELPELLNVIKGDMSLVGPRPLLAEYLDRYTARQSRRHEVKPGITGWAQIHGRNAIPWEERLELDVWYVDHWDIRLDIKIMVLTLVKVLKREGISSPTAATMEPFEGNRQDRRREV